MAQQTGPSRGREDSAGDHTTKPVDGARADALRDLWVFLPGLVPFVVFVGVAVGSSGQRGSGVLGAFLFIGGSAQLTTSTVLAAGSGVAAAVLAGLVVNARFMLYGAALAPRFAGRPVWMRWLAGLFVVDQTFLGAVERDARAPYFMRYWLWSGGCAVVTYIALFCVGVLLAPHLHGLDHVTWVGTALFLALLVPKLGETTTALTSAAAAGGALVGHVVAPSLAVPIGLVCGVAAALVTEAPKVESSS